jgi:hypothetical protein
MQLNGCTLYDNHNAIINVENGLSGVAPFLEVDNCTISGNSGDYGAAILNDNPTPPGNSLVPLVIVNNSTLSGNSASVAGGAIYNFNGVVSVSGSTLSGNTAAGDGGGIYNNGGAVNVGTTSFFLNTPDDIAGGFNDLGGNLFS